MCPATPPNMRILIAGAGIGGLTLAALLENRGVYARVAERAPGFEHAGYSLSLYLLGSRVLHGLGLYRPFAERSVEVTAYRVHDDRGRLLKTWSLEPIASRFGAILSSTRPALVQVLHAGLRKTVVEFDKALESLKPTEGGVHVIFSDGTSAEFDLVVGADGMHSRTRTVMFEEPARFDTGWGGWMWWTDGPSLPPNAFVEYWGTGRFLGAYPARDRVGVSAGAPRSAGTDRPDSGRKERLRRTFAGLGELVDTLLDTAPGDAEEMYFWKLADARSESWVKGRTVLLGDAAAGFLPTAGVGASMAMESAAVLNDEFSRTDHVSLEHALSLYVRRRRDRILRIQSDSRKLAGKIFLSSRPCAGLRNLMLRFYSTEMLARDIARAFDEPI
jgi:FAD-dependent urate hydroxylase